MPGLEALPARTNHHHLHGRSPTACVSCACYVSTGVAPKPAQPAPPMAAPGEDRHTPQTDGRAAVLADRHTVLKRSDNASKPPLSPLPAAMLAPPKKHRLGGHFHPFKH